ncbi:MAG: hypothetical protein JWM44_2187 [Bacilli bacterium]|nr:hypothetical protein [Bacilli bacterium]
MPINKKRKFFNFIHASKLLINYHYSVNNKTLIKAEKIIGVGARRVVYDLGNGYVLKIAKSKYGIKSNKREVITFNSCPTRVKKLLGEITNYEYKYHWVIMKKYTRKFPHLKKYKRKLYQLRRLFRNYGIYPYEVVSRKGKPNYKNLRLKKNGRIVVIDYGNFRFRRK